MDIKYKIFALQKYSDHPTVSKMSFVKSRRKISLSFFTIRSWCMRHSFSKKTLITRMFYPNINSYIRFYIFIETFKKKRFRNSKILGMKLSQFRRLHFFLK